ncbi:MAG: hypothetical protein GY770_35570, partial [Aestuariibacter sp.]|nr:hypothetical protein [Aestuariibacter sp.]
MTNQPAAGKARLIGNIGAFWGIAGVCLLLSFAVYRLASISIDAFNFPLQWHHWLVLLGNTIFMAHSEGYKGFQKGFSPRVAARARYLKNNPHPFHVLAAPLFCMGYFFTT